MRFTERENPINASKLNEYSNYWEAVRDYYFPFESGLKSGSAEVYTHEIPGGQYSNLKPQAKALGLEDKFHEITKMYAEVNQLFGDIVKVTPSSKVVGDMAQYLVSNSFSIADVLEKGETMSFPASVVSLFMGNLGQPVEGFPERIQQIVLKDKKPYTTRPNAHLEAIDIAEDFKEFTRIFKDDLDKELEITDYLSYKLYPKVFTANYNNYLKYNNLINLPTDNFFYGMNLGEEIIVELAKGKKLLIQLVSIGIPNNLGMVTVFFKVNGQSRLVEVKDEAISVKKIEHLKAEKDDTLQIGAPLQGLLSEVLVKKGDRIKANQPLFIIEAMKMETTITALNDALVNEVVLKAGTMVNSLDLIVRLEKLIN